MQWMIGTILPLKQMTDSSPSAAWRAPRVRATEYTPAVLRFPCGDCATGSLEVISSTGGLLRLSKPLIRGTRIKVMFLTQSGPVLGAAEMLKSVELSDYSENVCQRILGTSHPLTGDCPGTL